jgi:hypothetical protein
MTLYKLAAMLMTDNMYVLVDIVLGMRDRHREEEEQKRGTGIRTSFWDEPNVVK